MTTTQTASLPSSGNQVSLSRFLRLTAILIVLFFITFSSYSKPKGNQKGIGVELKSKIDSFLPIDDDDDDDDDDGLVLSDPSWWFRGKKNLIVKNVDDDDALLWENNHKQGLDNPFVSRHCLLESSNGGNISWYPAESSWKVRAPYFLLIGAKKCGTTALATYLKSHPLISPPRRKELLFYLPYAFKHWEINNQDDNDDNNNDLDQEEDSGEDYAMIRVEDARRDMWARDYPVASIQQNEAAISYEATPGYLLFSTYSARAILCTAPWVKILVTLRNPTDRVFSNYNFMIDPNRGDKNLPSFEKWVEDDIKNLYQAGVIPARTRGRGNRDATDHSLHSFYGSREERHAWSRYQRQLHGREGPVGRSLYTLQLEEWFDHLKRIGRDPRTDVFVVRNEELRADPARVMDTIWWWLGIPINQPIQKEEERMVTHYTKTVMKPETRAMLEAFFRPYNERLYKLLGWENIWDNHNQTDATALYELLGDNEEDERFANVTYNFGVERNETLSQQLADQWCVVDEDTKWFPKLGGPDEWMMRAPFFLVVGAMESGARSLSRLLMQHPLLLEKRSNQQLYFTSKNFRGNYIGVQGKTLVSPARKRMHKMVYDRKALERKAHSISMDVYPGQLFLSAELPWHALCVCPWIKLVVIVRNPVERLFSHHAFFRQARDAKVSFESWLADDWNHLVRSGFLNATTPQQEEEAWSGYLSSSSVWPMGRSLYEIQLRQWFRAFASIGRDPRKHIHVLRAEDLVQDVQGEMKKLHAFLGLPHIPVEHNPDTILTNHNTDPMKNETRQWLEEFFAPYNRKLYDFLGWDGYWDPPKNS